MDVEGPYEQGEPKKPKGEEDRQCICNDAVFAVVFGAYLVTMIVFACAWGQEGAEELYEDLGTDPGVLHDIAMSSVSICSFGLAFAILWALLMAFTASWFINLALVSAIIINFTVGGLLSWQLYYNWSTTWFWLGAVPFGLLGLVLLVYTCMVQSRIAFASANLRIAAKGLTASPGVFFWAIIAGFVQIAWFFCWIAATYGACTHFQASDAWKVLGVFLNLIGYCWGHFVLKGLVVVTTANVLARWWSDPSRHGSMRSLRAVSRSCTSNLGSVAFGALFTAILETIHVMLRSMAARSAREGNHCAAACAYGCAACLVRCIEDIVEYFNKWAFTFVGIESIGFCAAGTRVTTLFKDRGWTAVINDELVGNVLFLGAFISGLLCFGLGYNIGKGDSFEADACWFMGLGGFAVGIATAQVVFGAVGGAVNAVFVLFADRPEDLRREHPELYQALEHAWLSAHPVVYRGEQKAALNA